MAQTLELNADGEVRGPHPDPMLGRKLLHYRVVETIGQGGMSVVYRGVDEHLGRDVAIKVLHPFLAEKSECRTRLAREARVVARLEHANIVKVFDFSGDAPTLDHHPGKQRFDHEGFIVAELVRGPTLKRYCEKHALWRVPEVGALVVWQLLQALQHAHDSGVVHRDLKPENVMVRDDGVLKLMDFGIAQIADQSGLTVTGTLLGSPAHMAPECIDGHAVAERSDLFSLGTVLSWITTGSLPFEALTPHALLKQIVDGRFVPAQQKSARVSDDLARVIARSLQTNPDERYQTANEFAVALAEVVERSGLVVDSESCRRLLDQPVDLDAAGATVRATWLERAARHLEEGQTSRALSSLNRVLADDPDNEDARALLDRLHEDDDGDGDNEDGGALVAGAINDDVSYAPGKGLVGIGASGRVDSQRPPPTNSGGLRWQSFLVGASAVLMVGLAVVVARAIDAAVDPAVVVAPPAPPAVVADVDGSSWREDDRSKPPPPPEPVPVVEKLPPLRVERIVSGVITRPKVTAVTPASVAVPAAQKVTFRVKPWADIVVDGVVVARNTLAFEHSLSAGPHTVLFRNPRAKEHEVRFTVAADGPPPVITARLEPRPALLVVRTNVTDAFVDVAGAVGKPAHDTTTRPLVVALDERSRAEREVFVYKKGYSAYRKRHVFLAGETLELNVVLEPDAVEPVAPPTTP